MRSPSHHPLDEDLVAYAAGTAPEGLAVLVACHLTFCPLCRDIVSSLDTLAMMLEPSPWAADGVDELPAVGELFARLDAEPSVNTHDEVLPTPLRERVGPLADLPWSRLPLGVAHAWLPLEGANAYLIDFPAGLTLPEHRHAGVERAMPLVGGFTAEGSPYGVGDLSVADGETGIHRVKVDDDGRCLCLFVNDGELVPENPALRVVGWLLGIH